MVGQLAWVERVHRVCAKSGFDGEENRMGQDCCLEKGPEMGRRVLEKRACVLSSQTASARGAGDAPPSWREWRRRPPRPRDA